MQQPYKIPNDCNFTQVIESGFGRNGSGINQSNSCSPEIMDLNFNGIVINAPNEIIFDTDSTENNQNAIPLCGTYAHDMGVYIDTKKNFINSIIFVVVDTKTNETWSGQIPELQNLARKPKSISGDRKKLTLEEMKGRIIGGYFNPNIFNITSARLYETEYIVYATVGPYKSNAITIKATKRKQK